MSLSRRHFLHCLSLSAGAALGCRPDLGPSEIQGSIVGAAHEAGHRLRDGLPETPPGEVREVPLVIAGSGIAGLSAAWKLRRHGFSDFEVLELEEDAGGNSRWGENDVSAYPWAAHYLPIPTPESTHVLELLEEMGLVEGTAEDGSPIFDPRHLCHAPQERLFHVGHWQEGLFPRAGLSAEDARQVEAFEAEMVRLGRLRSEDGRPLFAIPLELSAEDAELRALDRISMTEYLRRNGWDGERLRWYVDYCCRDDYGASVDDTSAWAGVHYFAARPSLDPAVLTWPEGNGRIVRHLLEKIGPERVRTRQMVTRIHAREDGADVDVVDLSTEETYRLRARQVIFALPRFVAPYVLRDAAGAPYAMPGLDTFTYSPWMVANVTVRCLPEDPGTILWGGSTWDNILYDSPSLGYIVATHQDLRMTSGASVLTYYLPLSQTSPEEARRESLEKTWDDWVATILDDLGHAHPGIEALVTRVDVMLLGHAMIRPSPGFIWGEARRRAQEPFGAVTFAHSDMSGLSIFEEAQYWGVRAADEVLRRFSG